MKRVCLQSKIIFIIKIISDFRFKMDVTEFIDKILSNYQTKLPNYLKVLLSYAGYDNIISISKCNDICITE